MTSNYAQLLSSMVSTNVGNSTELDNKKMLIYGIRTWNMERSKRGTVENG
jgi:hypothetical protein